MKKTCISSLLTFLSLLQFSYQIQKASLNKDSMPLIGRLLFQEQNLFYISADEKQFGQIDKTKGSLNKVWQLDEGQQITTVNNEQIIITSSDSFTSFLLKEENFFQTQIDINITSEIIGFMKMSYGEYYITQDDLMVQAIGEEELSIVQFGEDWESDEKFIEMFEFNYRAIATSDSSQLFCFSEIDLLSVSRKICLWKSLYKSLKKEIPDVKVSGEYLYLVTEEETLILNRDFSVVEKFDHQPLQFHEGLVSVAGYQTYSPKNKMFENYKVISHQGSSELIKLKTVENREEVVVIQRLEEEIAEIQLLSEEPIAAWIDKSLAGIDFTWGLYDLIFQFPSGKLKMYSIEVLSSGDSSVNLEWSLNEFRWQTSIYTEDQLDIGYTPSIANKSRSAGMKKLTRKTENKSKPQPAAAKKNTQQDDFDLLDELLSPAKPKPAVSKTTKEVKNIPKDDIDSFFDEPSTITIGKEKPKGSGANSAGWNDWGQNKNESKINTTVNSSFNNRPQTAKGIPTPVFDDIIEETTNEKSAGGFNFKRPQTAVNTSKKVEIDDDQPSIAPSPSLRMMKPPLRKRQSKEDKKSEANKSEFNRSESGFGLTLIPDEPKSSILGKNQQKSSLFLPEEDKKPNNSLSLDNKRKSSAQIKKVDYNLKLDDEPDLTINNNKKKQEPFKSPPFLSKDKQLSLRLDSPKQNNYKSEKQPQQQQNKGNNFYSNNFNANPKNQNKLWEPQRSYIVQEEKNYPSNSLKIQSQEKYASHSEMQKQMEFMKKNYQKHVDTLQKNLEDQVRSNKESRDRLMKEVNQLIESQRSRLGKIHQEEIDRIKQMNEWQKKKVQENYKMQVESLRSQLERANSVQQSSQSHGYSSIEIDKKQIQYLEEKLRSERKSLEERQKILDRRELTLEESERQFTKRKRHEEERLRDEEKRIFQTQLQSKKNLMYQRKALEQEKQAMAAELASLQLGNFKKAEMSENMVAQLEIQKRELERQKREIRDLQNQMMRQYKQKQEEVRREKENVTRLESQLIHKLRIVETKAQKDNIKDLGMTNTGKTKVNKTINYKENTWMQENTQHNIRPMSSQKVTQHKKIEETQNRFLHITQNLKESMKASHKGSGGFDLDKYMMSMAKFTRTREQIC